MNVVYFCRFPYSNEYTPPNNYNFPSLPVPASSATGTIAAVAAAAAANAANAAANSNNSNGGSNSNNGDWSSGYDNNVDSTTSPFDPSPLNAGGGGGGTNNSGGGGGSRTGEPGEQTTISISTGKHAAKYYFWSAREKPTKTYSTTNVNEAVLRSLLYSRVACWWCQNNNHIHLTA